MDYVASDAGTPNLAAVCLSAMFVQQRTRQRLEKLLIVL